MYAESRKGACVTFAKRGVAMSQHLTQLKHCDKAAMAKIKQIQANRQNVFENVSASFLRIPFPINMVGSIYASDYLLQVYATGAWAHGGTKVLSGSGSTMS